jgi:RNA polymerase sigma-70 factor (ECF subfamily)
MYRIALNVAISFYRPAHRALVDVATLERPLDAEVADERVEQLKTFIAELGEVGKALMLLALDDHSHETIAAILGLTKTNVATKLGRLRARARTAMTALEGVAKGEVDGI